MNLKKLKDKVSNNLPEIILGAAIVAITVGGVIAIKKTLNATPAFRDIFSKDMIPIDLSNIDETNVLTTLIENSSDANILVFPDEAIIFLTN